MDEAGFIKDSRCNEALDLLESKQMKSEGWRSGGKFYKFDNSKESIHKINFEKVEWESAGNSKMNEWITLYALNVLKKAGRVKI